MKRRLIKDPVWGNIEIFPWESAILNHFIVNRLHNIVQNSNAYRAYPGLKYSRLLHSVGVMHVATHMFVNTVVNADNDSRNFLQAEADTAMNALGSARDAVNKEIFNKAHCEQPFSSLLAILRVSALIHDLGHFPLSHVFENALHSFAFGDLSEVMPITPDATTRRTQMRSLIEEKVKAAENTEETKLHEIISIILARQLAELVNAEEAKMLILLATDLLSGKSFPISATYIKGTIDADRIDFTRRDGLFSGLFSSSVDYGRVFSLYTLKVNDDKRTVACPSPRSVSEVEKLLWERFLDYKYIVVHHRVHLYDEILENILVWMMNVGRLSEFLDKTTRLLEFAVARGGGIKEQQAKVNALLAILLDFDDPWLESKIREVYRLSIKSIQDGGQNPADSTKPSASVEMLFEAYVEDRNRFTSLFKSDDEFWSACEKHAPRLASLGKNIEEADQPGRRYFFRALYAVKYRLQSHLADKLKFVFLIGPTEKKLNYGVRTSSIAVFYQVTDLVTYLQSKKNQTMLFNCWFDSQSRLAREEVAAKALPLIEEFLMKAMNQLSEAPELALD